MTGSIKQQKLLMQNLSLVTPASDSKVCQIRSCLKLELPNINGDHLKWMAFWKRFEPVMAKKKDLPDGQCASLLVNSMKYTTAKDIAERGSAIGDYKQALLDLEESYNCLRVIFPLYAENIFNYSIQVQ